MGNRKLAKAKAALRTGKLGHSRLARAVALGILLGGASALPVAAQAANSNWAGASSDEWSNDGNWVVPPVNGSFVLIDALDPNATHLRAPATVGAVLVGDQGQGRLVIEAGGQLDVAGSEPFDEIQGYAGLFVGHGAGSEGAVEVDGAGARLTVAEHVQIGQDGTGLLYVGNGGLAELAMHGMYAEVAVGSYVVPGQGSGHITVDGAGAVLRHAGGMNITNGALALRNGGVVESVERIEDADTAPRWVDVVGSASNAGQHAAGNGTATISGAGSAWNSRNFLQIGYGGTGVLQVLDGGTATFSGFTYVGNRSREVDADGNLTGGYLEGNGSLLVSGAGSSFNLESNEFPEGLRVGLYGQGAMRIEQGGTATVATTAIVGDNGVGTLEVDSGGTMTFAGSDDNGIGLTIGNVAGSDGSVNVNGAGSTLTVDAGAQIGNAGNGYLGVTNGGVANLGLETAFSETVLGFTFYGWGADAASGYGSLQVSGPGSTVNYAGGINVLNADISVLGGGQLKGVDRTSDNAFWTDLVGWGVPADPNSGFAGLHGSAYVEIDGEGSGWHSVNGLSVGSGGDGTLAIRNGGDASFAGYVEIGGISYVYDSPTGSPVEGIPPQAGSGLISVSGAGSTFTLNAAPGTPEWGLGLLEVGVNGSGYVQVDNGGLLTTAGGIQLGEQGQLVIGGWAEDESPLGAGTVVTPSIQIDAGGSLEFRHNGSTTLGAAITGDGWIGASGGHTTLSGDSSDFSGNVGIDHDAVLEVTGAFGAGFLGVGHDSTGTLLVSEGGAVHAGSTVLGNVVGGNGNVVVSGAGSSFTVDGWASIGRDGHGSLGVFDGASASLAMTEGYSETTLGFGDYGWTEHPDQGQGSIAVDGAGSTLDYAGGLNVLNGSLQVSNGGQVASHDRGEGAWVDLIGWGVPADPDPEHGFGGLHGIAFASVSGAGSGWNSLNLLSLGEGGEGRLEVTAGGDADFSGYVRLGTISYIFDAPGGSPLQDVPPATGQGSILVSGAGSSFDVNALEGDESWQQGDLYVGYSIGSSGDVTISYGASSDVDGRLVAGRNGSGSVAILDGGSMLVHGSDANLIGLAVGETAGSDGQVRVTGAGSTLVVDAGAQIGNSSDGSLWVDGGGHAQLGLELSYSETILGFGYYGWTTDTDQGHGSIKVDGAGSLLEYAGGLNVLNGDVSVANGGQLAGVYRESFWIDLVGWGVPANPGMESEGLPGSAHVDISGDGSGWHSVNALNIGNGGNGNVTVRGGGDASFAGFVDLGSVSYVYDSPGVRAEGVPPQAGSGSLTVSGAGSTFTLDAAPGAPTWGLGLMTVGVAGGPGYVQVDNGGRLTVAGGIELGEQGLLVIGGWAEDESPLAAGTVVTPTIQVDAGGSLQFHHDSTTTLAASISGDGWMGASGAGLTTLTGDGSGFTGNLGIDDGATLGITGPFNATYVQVGGAGSGTLLVDGAGEFNSGSAILGDASGSHGAVVVSGKGSSFTVDGQASIGRDGLGSLSVTGGASASLAMIEWYTETTLGFGDYGWSEDPEQGRGSILVEGAGSTLDYAGGLNLLNGSLDVTGGGQVTSHARDDAQWIDVIGWGVPADPDPAHGFGGLYGQSMAHITGEGSAWTSGNMVSVGEGGQGTLQVDRGAVASFSGYARLGTISYIHDEGGSPRMDVPAAPGSGTVFVANAGSRFDIHALEGAEWWQQGDLYVGYSVDSTGDFTIADAAASDIDGRLVIGRRGTGWARLMSAATLVAHGSDANGTGMVLGDAAGSYGRFEVSGEGTLLKVDGGAQIGNAGEGLLVVRSGADAEIGLGTTFSETLLGFAYYGWGADAAEGEGNILVDGAGTTLTYGGGMNVLNGAVTVSGGAKLASAVREADGDTTWLDLIGFGVPADPVAEHGFSGLYGTALAAVSGAGSAWISQNALSIANGGEGLLAVTSGGSASFIGDSSIGTLGYLFDAETNRPAEGVPGQPGSGAVVVYGAGSRFTIEASASDAGVLHVGHGGEGLLVVGDGATARIAGGIEVGAGGHVLVGGESAGHAAGFIQTPSVSLLDPDATLTFFHNTPGFTTGMVISGTGQVHAGAGFTMLTGDSSAFDGDTLVDGGATLSVNGSLGGDLMVATDGRLQGSGTVENLTVAGTLAPGNSPGTLSIAGDLLMQSGSVFEAEIDPVTGAYDAVAVAGNVIIKEGTVLSVSKLGDAQLAPGTSVDLIQTGATTTVEGQFSQVTGGSAFLGYGVDYTGGEINLNVTRSEDVTFEGAVGADFGGLGKALDGLSDDNALMQLVFFKVTSTEQAQQVLADMAGTMHADLRRELVDGSRHLRGALTDRLVTAPDSGSGWWAQAMNDQGHMDAEGLWPSVEIQRTGMLVGYDMEVGATRLGAAIGTGTGEYDADGKLSNADLRDRHVSVYGSSDFGAMRLGYGLGVSWTGIESERHFAIGDVQQDLMGDRDARTEQIFVEAARRYGAVEHRFFEPFLSVAHVRVHDGGFEEQGGLAALAVEGDVAAATFGKVGVRWALGGERAQWTGSVGMRYARGFDHGEAEASFVSGGDHFPIRGLGLDGNMLDISMGGRFELSERAHLWAGYESLMGGNSSNDGVKVQFSFDL